MQRLLDGDPGGAGLGSRKLRTAALACESLETRTLLSTTSTLFSRFGVIEAPGRAATVSLPLGSDRLEAPRSGRVLLDLEVQPDSGSRLDPGWVRISRGDGAGFVRRLPRSGHLLLALQPNDLQLTVGGRGDSTGAFVASVRLVGDADGDGDVQRDDLARLGSGEANGKRFAQRNLGAASLDSRITFQVVNATSPKADPSGPSAYSNSQVYVAITGQDAATGQFVHLDRDGNAVPMKLSDNKASNHLTKNGVEYSNYFLTLDQVAAGWDVPYNLTGARLWVGLGEPLYFKVNSDVNGNLGYTTPNLSDPSDPNIDLYWDHTEFATVGQGINANTTQVDQFGFPQLMTLKADGQKDQVVGVDASRSAVFSAYQANVPAEFQSLLTAQAPFRAISPKHGAFSQSQNPSYFDAYINQVWTHYQTTTWTFTNVLGTFSGTVDATTNVLKLTQTGVVNGPTYSVRKPQTWEIFAAAGNMATGNAVELAVEAQIVAGVTRHVALDNPTVNVTPFLPSVIDRFYAESPANAYAHFWHQQSVNGLAYGFDYDDVYNQNPSVTAAKSASPRLIVSVGWN